MCVCVCVGQRRGGPGGCSRSPRGQSGRRAHRCCRRPPGVCEEAQRAPPATMSRSRPWRRPKGRQQQAEEEKREKNKADGGDNCRLPVGCPGHEEPPAALRDACLLAVSGEKGRCGKGVLELARPRAEAWKEGEKKNSGFSSFETAWLSLPHHSAAAESKAGR